MLADSVPTTQSGTRDTGGDHYRYPGSPPFRDDELDRRLFKGRAREIDHVLHSILSSDLFLLYSVSGLGKTSLLNAGVMHRLRARGYWPVSVRLNNINMPPVEQIREQIEQVAAADPEIELLRDPDAPKGVDADRSLWGLLTSIEVWRSNELQELVLVLDQFEELFTLGWDENVQAAFIADFGEVVRGHRAYQTAPSERFQPRPNVKIVLAMREDALGELEALSAEVPQIMANRFRLGPLDPVQAERAITEPAGLDDPRLGSQRFTYTAAAAKELLDFLRTKTLNGSIIQTAAVDPSQLQIVCQYVERAIVPEKATTQSPDSVVEIDAADLEGKEGLNRILSDFYRRTIESFPSRSQRSVRDLCETGLISRSQRRLSLEEGEVEASHAVSPEMLQQLVDARILRSEPRVGSVYYELAHDTLVRPILEYRDWRRRQRTVQRLRWIGIAAGVAVLALAFVGFSVASSQADSDNLEAQETADQEAVVAVDEAATAGLEAELATQAASRVTPKESAAADAALAATEERQNAVAALAQTQATAEAAQVPEAADEAQPLSDPVSSGADVEIGQAAAGAAQAAVTAAEEQSKDAQDAATEAASQASTAAQGAADATPETLAAAETAAGRAQAAAAESQAAADSARAAVAIAEAAVEAAQSALVSAEAAEKSAQAEADLANARVEAARAALTAAEAAEKAAKAGADAADARVDAAQEADGEAARAAETAQLALVTAQRAVVTAQDALDDEISEQDKSKEAAELAALVVVAEGELAIAGRDAQTAVTKANEAATAAQAAADAAATSAANALENAETVQLPGIELKRGVPSGQYFWYNVTLSNFEAGTSVTLTCQSAANPTGFYAVTLTVNEDGSLLEDELCFSLPGQEHWVSGGGVESERLVW